MANEDLLKDTSQYVERGDYFLLTITDLDINTSYPIQFRWKKKDGSFSVWSGSRTITTPGESFPGLPSTLTVTGGAGILTVTWDGKDSLGNNLTNFDRVDVYIDNPPFDGTKATTSFFTAGTKTISAPAGTYIVSAYAVSKAGTRSAVNTPVTRTVLPVEEAIQTPVAPSSTGFSSTRVLSGVTVSWNGAYPTAWTGFQAINIYAGTSATLTSGTYIKVGQMTANKISNTITIPVDGTYVRYDLPVYIHASSVNRNSLESSLVANVTNQLSGARSAIGSDLADTIISSAKLVDDAVTAVKIATDAITTTKIANDAITSAKIFAGSVTSAKIDALAITADKIAANAITASKILAGEIDVTKLAAGTISVNNLQAGNISSTSFIRAGSGNTGARVEMSSAAISGGPAAGFYIYNSAGTAVLSAPLSGGLSIVGDGTFTGNLSIGSSNNIFKAEPATGIWLGNSAFSSAPFSVSVNGSLKAESGTIGGWTLGADFLSTTNFKISKADATIFVGNPSGQHIRMSSTSLAHYNGSSTTDKFTLTASNGNLTIGGTITASSASLSGYLSAGSARFGTDVNSTNDGIYINTNNYWYDDGSFKVGDSSSSASWNGTTLAVTGNINANSGRFGNASTGWTLSADGTLSNGTAGSISATTLFPSANNTSIGIVGNSNVLSYFSNRGIMVYPGSGSPYGYTAIGNQFVTYSGSAPHISSNLAVRINDSFAPNSDDAYTLGFTTARWQIVRSAGGVSTTSDMRIKKDIVDSELGLNFINALRPVSFKMISGGKIPKDGAEKEIVNGVIVEPEMVDRVGLRTHWGFLAQQVKEAVDQCGVEDFAGWQLDDINDPESRQSLVHHEFLGPIVKAIQELSDRLDALEG
jgi:hypothetical protein